MGIAWASGINLYATIATLGLLGATGNMDLPPDLVVLSDPLVIGAAGFMYFVEFLLIRPPGSIPAGIRLHTFIRIPAGAILAAGAIGDVGVGAELAEAIAGGTLTGVTHFTKVRTRLAINTFPEPFSNWTASILEDIAVLAGLWAVLNHPLVFLGLLGVFIILMIWRALKAVYRKL